MFSQDSVSRRFQNGSLLKDLVQQLRDGQVHVMSAPFLTSVSVHRRRSSSVVVLLTSGYLTISPIGP
jgi:hypothetical protein